MFFSLNQSENLIEVLFDNGVIDSFPKHHNLDFKYYYIVVDLHTKCDSYHTSQVFIDSNNDRQLGCFRIVIDDDAYKKYITNNSSYCCVYNYNDRTWDKCHTVNIYNSTGKLGSFEGQQSSYNSHNFTFLQSKDSNNGGNKPYLIVATNRGLQVFNLTDIENTTILWKFSSIYRIGITPLTNSGKKYFFVCVSDLGGGQLFIYLLDFNRFVNVVYKVTGYYTEIYDDKQYIYIYVSDDFTGRNIYIFYRNRFYDWIHWIHWLNLVIVNYCGMNLV